MASLSTQLIFLKGVFRPQERLYRVVDWLSAILSIHIPFLLSPPVAKQVLDGGATLQELDLVPASILTM